MNIILKMRKQSSSTTSHKLSQSNDKSYGEWGRVEELHSDDCTVDVLLASGIFLNRVPVACNEWVTLNDDTEKGYNTGARDLPPKYARVFVIMPRASYSDCFVAPFSCLSSVDQPVPFMEDGKERIKDRITPSGWQVTTDDVTGSYKAVSPDKKTSLEIDYGTKEDPKEDAPELHLNLFDQINADVVADDKVVLSVFDELHLEHVKGDSCTLKVFDTELVIKDGEVSIKPKKTTIEVEGNAEIKTSGKTTIEASGDAIVKGANVTVEAASSATINAVQVQITGGSLQVSGTAAPGSGPFCALPACLFTGAPHGGNIVSGT